MQIEQIIQNAFEKVNSLPDHGNLASYIPELASVSPNKFAVHVTTTDGYKFGIGDYQERFSIQSIAKVLSLTMVYHILNDKTWDRVGVEPSGTAFNSLVQLEADKGIPRNPFINAGAFIIVDMLISEFKNPKQDFLAYVRSVANNSTIQYSERIAASEKSAGYRNVALCNFIKSLGNLNNSPDEVLDFYFDLCSLEMNCEELCDAFMFLATKGINEQKAEMVLTPSESKRINALMQTCGFYDESGEFAFKVGLPGKSGVGGGIIAVLPNEYTIAVWSPKLNAKFNSYKGLKFLEEFTSRSEMSIF